MTSVKRDRPEHWGEESHSNNVDPQYKTVFPEYKVNEIKLIISPKNWQLMQDNMTELYGDPNSPTPRPDQNQQPQPGPPGNFSDENPMWVEGTIEFQNKKWTHVGIRFKGNSSLMGTWRSGGTKLPFKFDFDQWEDEYPEIKNQRFYGFKQLSVGNSYGDPTYLRESFANHFYAELDLPVSRIAPFHITVDYGQGQKDYGIYTAVEVVDDTVVENFFGEDSGNIYEADGSDVTLKAGTTLEGIESSFLKENNSTSDWSDIESLYTLLHDPLRESNQDKWALNLSHSFDTDSFLKWLAASAALKHWDTYGAMTHNFYIYNNPSTQKLTWITWDHNLILDANIGGGSRPPKKEDDIPSRPPQRGNRNNVSFDKAEITDQWPLIRFVLDNKSFNETYHKNLIDLYTSEFNPSEIKSWLQTKSTFISPYLKGEEKAQYDQQVEALIHSIEQRHTELGDYLK